MKLRSLWIKVCLSCVLFATTVVASSAQVFKTLVNFDGVTNGYPGFVSLVQGTDGNLYGTTDGGRDGSIFRMTPGGILTTTHSFAGQDGATPLAGLLLGTDGVFYRTTVQGGSGSSCSSGCGTIFKITRDGVLTTLHNFVSSDGASPVAGLIQGTDGNLYGTTEFGGTGNCTYGGSGCGTVFKIDAQGQLTTLHSFNYTDGWRPDGALIQANDGNLYGTTVQGGAFGYGTVFRVTPAGVLATLYSFCTETNCTDGANPFAALVQASNGDFYGTTSEGGSGGCAWGVQGGTIFRLTPGGTLTTLASVCTYPDDPLIRATNGSFYGSTVTGGDGGNSYCTADFGFGCGTIFRISAGEVLSTVHNFNYTDGATVYGGLFQATNGRIYGTTEVGGTGLAGTIFSLDLGLSPFITFVAPAGKVGKTAQILGSSLTGTTSVTFNGVAAMKFSVVSDTYLTAVVPAGATTGAVVVATPAGDLTSNVSFTITH
jgi:uncharacterized repeat protein (TIGR03803 family)